MFKYLLKPYFGVQDEKYTVSSKVAFLLYAYVISIFVTILIMRVTEGMDYILTHRFHQPAFYQLADKADANWDKAVVQYRLVLFVLVAPLGEELIFRLPLDLKKRSFAVAAFVITGTIFQKYFYITDWRTGQLCIDYLLAALLAIAVYYFLPGASLQKLKGKKFGVFFYGSAILFSLLHIGNFYTGLNAGLFFLPLLVIPQFVSALFLGTIRMRYGFWWGVLLHVLFNLPGALIL